MKTGRRRFLVWAGCGLAAGGLGYAYHRGLRFPPPLLAGGGPASHARHAGVAVAANGALFQSLDGETFRFRAFVPEPAFTVRGEAGRAARIVVDNVHRGARLEPGGGANVRALDEDQDNLTRTVSVTPAADRAAGVAWRFPSPDRYRFAAIGDTGGGSELGWVLQRAVDLDAAFLIHLGDFYYEGGDFERAAQNLAGAAMPVYSAIGNHDFHDDWRIRYPAFHRLIGPSNSIFTLGGVEFVNLDTAADFFPAERGRRAQMLQRLGAAVRDRVAFTHMPLRDPDPERDHAIGRPAEAAWIRDKLLSSGTRNLLAGHIHIKDELDDHGLHTYITGQGLAHADLITGRPTAEILLGDVEPGEPVSYRWQPLNMPFEAHCNRRNLKVLDALERPEIKNWLLEQCGKA